MKQLDFEKNKAFQDFKKRREHGGDIRAGKRKLARPFDPAKALHLVLHSNKAKGEWSFLKRRNENKISRLIYTFAAKYQITVYKYGNAGNHLHLLLRARSLKGFQRFLRTITGLIARHVMGAKRGKAKGRFWNGLAYTKLISWGRHFKNTMNYVWKNALEGWGVIPPRTQAKNSVNIDFQTLYDCPYDYP